MDESRAPKRQRTSSSSPSEPRFSANIPSILLHRFKRDIRTNRTNAGEYVDVITTVRDGVEFVVANKNTKRGASFFYVTSSDDISKAFHAHWKNCTCFVTAPGSELDARFNMKHTGTFNFTLDLTIDGSTKKEKVKVGEHYSLVPRVDMPMKDYVAECERIMAALCQIRAAGCSGDWPPKNPWPPVDRVMDHVVVALYHYAYTHAEDPNLSLFAGLYYCSLGDSSMSLEDILRGDDQRLIDLIYESWKYASMEEADDEPCSYEFRRRVCELLEVHTRTVDHTPFDYR